MEYKDIPKSELSTGRYSEKTINGLYETNKRGYVARLKRGCSTIIPAILGVYLCLCSALGGYALSHNESIFFFDALYVGLGYLFFVLMIMYLVIMGLHYPRKRQVIEEIEWYKEVKSNGCSIKI